MKPWVLSACFGAFVVAGCGGSAATIDDPSEDASPSPSGSATSLPLPVAVDAGADVATSVPDASGGKDGAVADRRIDPIEVGRAWTYDVKVLGFYPLCEAGSHIATARSATSKDGKTAIDVTSLCKNAGAYEYAVEGDRVFTYLGGWRLVLDAPVAEGHTWSDTLRNYVWESRGTQTVPAGTFGECWSATVVARYTSYTVFCRGVGPVKWHYEDGLGNGYEAVLTRKSF
jgi:hypothetical protein